MFHLWRESRNLSIPKVPNPEESPLYADVRHIDEDPEPPPSAPPIPPEDETLRNQFFASTPASHERFAH